MLLFSSILLRTYYTFNFFPLALKFFSFRRIFRLSPLQKHVRKVVCVFGKKSCVSTGVRKPGNTYASLAVKVALNPSTAKYSS